MAKSAYLLSLFSMNGINYWAGSIEKVLEKTQQLLDHTWQI